MRNNYEIKKLIQAGEIHRASFATVNSQGTITPYNEYTNDVVFQCASLSKPVFAYLTLKLIELNKTRPTEKEWPGKFKTSFNLDTPLYTVFGKLSDNDNPFLQKFSMGKRKPNGPRHQEEAKQLTARMVLSHTTGLPIVGEAPLEFQFAPGTHYNYSGPGIECLQEVIEELTLPSLKALAKSTGIPNTSHGNSATIKKSILETLAQEHIFGDNALKMPNSTFGDSPSGANSLKSTTEEYARFIQTWINDKQLNFAFLPVEPADSMMNDFFPNPDAVKRLVKNIEVSNSDRRRVAWGLGVGLVKNTQGEIIGIYHTGDMGNEKTAWRAGFGATINPETGKCTEASVYLTESKNGHMLGPLVLPAELKPALDYFFPTYGFARNIDELHNTDFHGLNPAILIKDLQKAAGYNPVQTTEKPVSDHARPVPPMKSSDYVPDTTVKMLHQMNAIPPAPKAEKHMEKMKSQEPMERDISKTEEMDIKTSEEIQSSPTPFSTSYTPD